MSTKLTLLRPADLAARPVRSGVAWAAPRPHEARLQQTTASPRRARPAAPHGQQVEAEIGIPAGSAPARAIGSASSNVPPGQRLAHGAAGRERVASSWSWTTRTSETMSAPPAAGRAGSLPPTASADQRAGWRSGPARLATGGRSNKASADPAPAATVPGTCRRHRRHRAATVRAKCKRRGSLSRPGSARRPSARCKRSP